MSRALVFLFLVSLQLQGCSREGASPDGASPRMLVGAGATLPYPLYSKWAAEYARVDPSVRVNYQSIGSGAGARQVSDGVIDFGAIDEPMIVDHEHAYRTQAELVHVPTTIGAVVFAFNLPNERELSLTGALAAEIFLGHVARWDDARIRAQNPGRELGHEPIIVVHRADGSGTSAALTTYLAKNNEAWRALIGEGTSPHFPVGVGAKGNEGVAAFVKATPHAIGYVELVYAHQAGLAMARVQNRAGAMIAPTLEALELAAKSANTPADDDSRALLVGAGDPRDARSALDRRDAADPRNVGDGGDPGAYPIAALSFVVVPRKVTDRGKSEALAKFLWWAVHDGQRFARDLDYVPLPASLVGRAEQALRGLRAEGRPLLPTGG